MSIPWREDQIRTLLSKDIESVVSACDAVVIDYTACKKALKVKLRGPLGVLPLSTRWIGVATMRVFCADSTIGSMDNEF